jgi:hypothetical protein
MRGPGWAEVAGAEPPDDLLGPIRVARGARAEVEDDGREAERSVVELDPARVGDDATLGLGKVSGVEVVCLPDGVAETGV